MATCIVPAASAASRSGWAPGAPLAPRLSRFWARAGYGGIVQTESWSLEVRRGYVQDAVAVSKLLAQAFVSCDPEEDECYAEGGALSGASLLQYQLKLLAVLQWQASTLGQAFITVTAVDPATGQLAGIANVTPGLDVADAADHYELGPADVAATISNMAVAAGFRRRGLGRELLAACERAAADYSPPASLLGMACYRHNEAAVRLYETSGYAVDDSWMDQRWAESAEKGRVGFARRQLMVKSLRPDGRLPPLKGSGKGGGGKGQAARSA